MNIDIGALMDHIAGELEVQVVNYMQEYNIPASLMDKVLDKVQANVRKGVAESYATTLFNLQMELAQQEVGKRAEKQTVVKEGTVEDLKRDMEENAIQPIPIRERKGGNDNADIQCEAGKQSKSNPTI